LATRPRNRAGAHAAEAHAVEIHAVEVHAVEAQTELTGISGSQILVRELPAERVRLMQGIGKRGGQIER
jgi:hypothetical protein